LKGTKGKEM